uniref:carbonic anhydrase n=1 Tax=Gopherus evgoodei TaxID=1825980 RepID=A0A8C4WSH6_9SAUR
WPIGKNAAIQKMVLVPNQASPKSMSKSKLPLETLARHWSNDYPDCGGQAQSPIDIRTKSVQHDPALPPIEPQGYRSPGVGAFTLHNNGHTVEMSLPPSMFLRGLPQTYAAVQLHFHWGNDQDEGSEHQVNGESCPAELHIVHYNSESYANITEAKQQADGLAVLGIFIEVGDVANPAYDNIFNQLKNIQYAGQNVSIPPFDVHELLPRKLGHYFRYNGSLTTPPCSQNVLWTVFQQRVQISSSQVLALEGLYSTKAANSVPLVDNYRAPQPLNQRVVFSSFPVGECIGPSWHRWGVAAEPGERRTGPPLHFSWSGGSDSCFSPQDVTFSLSLQLLPTPTDPSPIAATSLWSDAPTYIQVESSSKTHRALTSEPKGWWWHQGFYLPG